MKFNSLTLTVKFLIPVLNSEGFSLLTISLKKSPGRLSELEASSSSADAADFSAGPQLDAGVTVAFLPAVEVMG